jgi:sugar/nucleoside kinase (ribokinase family)
MLGRGGQIITRYAEADRGLFEPVLSRLGVPVTTLRAASTNGFGFRYDGEQRSMTVDSIGQPWSPEDASSLEPDIGWVHVAPLLRSDFPVDALAALAGDGRTLSYDGQGLVRVPEIGPMKVDATFDPDLLGPVSVLKLAEDEAVVVAGGEFGERHARTLGPREILVTFGSDGCTLYVEGAGEHVPAAWPVLGIQTTGAGDVFMVGYVVARADGAEPRQAVELASELVARMLEERKRGA